MTQRNVIRNPAREQITAAIKAALDAFPNRSELARRIGVSRKQTYEWEAGNNTPSLETLAALAEATGTPIILAFGPMPETQKQPPEPEWVGRLEKKVDAIYERQGTVAATASRQVIEALSSPELMDWQARIAARLAALPTQSSEGSDDPPDTEDRGGAGPTDPGLGSFQRRAAEE